eukprot:6049956-Prorocentrum_lima.AAC.1
MTSSLVGSEMCIRDSPRVLQVPARGHGQCPVGHMAAVHHDWVLPRVLRRPVSYTHLTLPTICSV